MNQSEIFGLLQKIKLQEKENNEFLHLTANENQMSKTAMEFMASPLSERYYFGGGVNKVVDFNPFTVKGIDSVENLVLEAEKALKEMLHAEEVNINVLSGIHAMICSIAASTEPGDLIMTIDPDNGGHFATRTILERIGRKGIFAKFHQGSMEFNIEEIANEIKDNKVKALYVDLMNYTHPFDLKKLRELIGDEILIIYDASHTIGLMLGDEFQSPLAEGADIICANTHKTLPGPHKGLIAYKNKELGAKVNSILAGKFYSSVQTNHLIALAITILEMKFFGKEYAQQIISNSLNISRAFESMGYTIRKNHKGEFSRNHQVHIFLDDKGDRKKLYQNLIDNNISTNFNWMSDKKIFMRLGTQEITRRGMTEKEMIDIAEIVDSAFQGDDVKNLVKKINNEFKTIKFSFDN